MILNDTKLILNDFWVNQAHLGPIWYHSEPSDIPYSSLGQKVRVEIRL